MASLPAGIIVTLSLLVLLTASRCVARDFVVASGPDGLWRTLSDPRPEPHHQFQVNDTLIFFHDIVEKAVLWVSKDHYGACNTTQPILCFAGEGSRFVLNTTGNYYFISTDARLCKDGHRLVVQVIADTPSPVQLPPPPPPAPKLAPPPSSTGNDSSSSVAPPTAPKPPSSSPSAGNTSSSLAPPPSPPCPSGGNNASICSPAPAPAPKPEPNGTYPQSPPPSSSAMAAMRSGVLPYIVIVGAAIILA